MSLTFGSKEMRKEKARSIQSEAASIAGGIFNPIALILLVIAIAVTILTLKKSSPGKTERGYTPSEEEKAKAMALAEERARIVEYRDATFENIEGNWWYSVQGVGFAENPISLAIQTKGNPPTEVHFKLLHRVWGESRAINTSLENEVYHYYKSIRDSEFTRMSELFDTPTAKLILPKIENETEVWRVCGYSEFVLPIQTSESITYQISLICNWDDVNGLPIQFKDNQISTIGN